MRLDLMFDFLQNFYEIGYSIGISKECRIVIPLFQTAPKEKFLYKSYPLK